jgi:DNA-directed RNA polymerase specialized sigma24 family protein
MMPKKSTGISKLADFGYRCSLTLWLKIITENYCRQLYSRRIHIAEIDIGDRLSGEEESLNIDSLKLDMEDEQKILDMMPNQRYRKLIEYRYVENKTNEETALLLGMSMANYYNKHKLAKAQYCEMLRKEGLI